MASRSMYSTSQSRPASSWQVTPGGTFRHFAHAAAVSTRWPVQPDLQLLAVAATPAEQVPLLEHPLGAPTVALAEEGEDHEEHSCCDTVRGILRKPPSPARGPNVGARPGR